MDIENIQCQKRHINELQNWNQQRFLIKQLCDRDFKMLNLVEIDFMYFNQNFIFMILICFIFLPITVIMLNYIIKRYFCKQLIYFSRQHNYGPTFSATYIVGAAINFRPMINSWIDSKRYGSVIYQIIANLCIATYLLAPKGNDYIQLQHFGIFSVMVLNFVVTFDLSLILKSSILFITFLGYLIGSKISDQKDLKEQMQVEYEFEEDEEDDENEFVSVSSMESQVSKVEIQKIQKLELNNVLTKDDNTQKKRIDEYSSLTSTLIYLITVPIRIIFRFIYCSINNPFMETKLRYIIVSISAINVYMILQPMLQTTLVFYSFLIVYIGLIFYCLFINEGKSSELFFEFLATLSVLRVIYVLMSVFVDFMFFFQYYNNGDYDMNYVLFQTVPLLFFKICIIYNIAKQKELKLALISIFSCSIIYCTLVMSITSGVLYFNDVDYFRVYFFSYDESDKLMAYLSKDFASFFIIMNIISIMVLILYRIYMQINDFKFDKLIGNGLMFGFSFFYITLVLVSLTFQFN